jgi:hypothetical protein
MSLRPVGDGLWADPDRSVLEPATYAVVIGVSAYRHLDGGPEPAPHTYGLGQLAVSAYTAYRFFSWLRSGYFFTGAPLARCWLLLAPTPAEQAAAGIRPGDCAEARYDRIEQAVGEWFELLEELPAQAARDSRAFFFFSGHGIEVTQDNQVLLPADWLRPPQHALNRAISTTNLTTAMRRLGTEQQLFFVDACRSGPDQLRTARIDGACLLNEYGPELNNPRVDAGVMYATGSGSQAWQPAGPDGGPTLFGQALLEGLAGQVHPHPEDEPPGIWYGDVFRYVKARVGGLLRAAGSAAEQPVRGSLVDLEICQCRPGQAWRGGGSDAGTEAIVPDPAGALLAARQRFADAAPGDRLAPELAGRIRVTDLLTGQEPRGGPGAVRVRRADPWRYRLELAPDGSGGPLWLELDGGACRFATVLPGIPGARYALELELDAAGPDREPVECRVTLAPCGIAVLDRAAELDGWHRAVDARAAADRVGAGPVGAGPVGAGPIGAGPIGADRALAAAVTAGVLLRAGRPHAVLPWLGALADRFVELPDLTALWAETLFRLGPQGRGPDCASVLARSAGYPVLPVTADAFGYAHRLASVLCRTLPADDPRRPELERLRERLSAVAALHRPGGLFLTLGGSPEQVRPSLVQTS